MIPSDKLLARFGARSPVLANETGIATIWKVHYRDGFAALKIYKNGNTQDEWPGFDLLDALAGKGTAWLYQRSKGAVLMEWLDRPTLGDLSRDGQDDLATQEIGWIANAIHASKARPNLRSLEENFKELLSLKISKAWPPDVQSDFAAAQKLAAKLIANQVDIRALHGDLHHDNIMLGERGYVAIDAKGLIGDRAYDVANAFKNPLGAYDVYGDSGRIMRMANDLSTIMKIPRTRLLGWAAAHCALSIIWTGQIIGGPDLPQLKKLLAAYHGQG